MKLQFLKNPVFCVFYPVGYFSDLMTLFKKQSYPKE